MSARVEEMQDFIGFSNPDGWEKIIKADMMVIEKEKQICFFIDLSCLILKL